MARPVRRGARFAAVVLFASALVACLKPIRPPQTANVDRLCNALCARKAQCPPAPDAQLCQAQCRAFGSRLRVRWRDDYVEAAARCLNAASCDVIEHDVDPRCFDATRPEPTAIAHKACAAMVEKDKECVLGDVPGEDECMKQWGVLDDRTLEKLTDCEKLPCGNHLRRNCVDRVLGV